MAEQFNLFGGYSDSRAGAPGDRLLPTERKIAAEQAREDSASKDSESGVWYGGDDGLGVVVPREPKTLRPDQMQLIEDVRATAAQGIRRIMVQAPTAYGKCQGLGTPILMFDGRIVAIENVKAGDRLMGPDSKSRTVISTCRGRGPLFRIVPTKGDSWVCNDVHMLTLVNTTTDEVLDIPLDEYLRRSKWFKHLHKQFAPERGIDFRGVDPDVSPYWLGLWIGDGTKALNGLAISKPDAEVLEECRVVAVANGGFVRTDGDSCPTHHIVTPRGQPNRLLTRMRELMGSGDIPLVVLTASRSYRSQVLAGIIDTDGHHNGGCIEIVQKSRKIADGIMFLARSLGLRATVSEKIVIGNVYWRMGLSGDFSDVPMRIARKTPTPRIMNKVATRAGFSVEPIGDGEYAGFMLDDDGRYLMGDFTVTHNTIVAADVVRHNMQRGMRSVFVVDGINLVEQTVQKFLQEGITQVGVIQADHHMADSSQLVQVASVQTLTSRHRGQFPEADLVVIDEAHVLYKYHKAWLAEGGALFVGLSATPYTKGLGLHFDTLITAATTEEMIRAGVLSRPRVFSCGHPDLKKRLRKVKVTADDYNGADLSRVMSDKELTADIVQSWQDHWGRTKTLVFAVDRLHAKSLQARFKEAGFEFAYQDADTPREDRVRIEYEFHAEMIRGVISVGTMVKGLDWDVRCESIATPTKSRTKFKQMVGRALRTAEGKDYALILDHGRCTEELGFVTDIEQDHLDRTEVKKRMPKPVIRYAKQCPKCEAIKPRGALRCEECGFEPTPRSPWIETNDELEEVTRHKKPTAKKREMTRAEQAQFFCELKGYAKDKNYNNPVNWAVAKFRERLGHWPPYDLRYMDCIPCGERVKAWIISSNIRYHKGRAKAAQGNGFKSKPKPVTADETAGVPVTKLPPGRAIGVPEGVYE